MPCNGGGYGMNGIFEKKPFIIMKIDCRDVAHNVSTRKKIWGRRCDTIFYRCFTSMGWSIILTGISMEYLTSAMDTGMVMSESIFSIFTGRVV